MTIASGHLQFYREIFAIDGVLSQPFLMLGYQEVVGDDMPPDFRHDDLKQILAARGIHDVSALDPFDPRADLQYDLNLPVPEAEIEKYAVVFDIGCLEHVFDTRQCIENCLRMVKTGGTYVLHTPVSGYFGHGLHVLSPEALTGALRLNGFEVLYERYCTRAGLEVADPSIGGDVLMWIVARKTRRIDEFAVPQQGKWETEYAPAERKSRGERPTLRPPGLKRRAARVALRLLRRLSRAAAALERRLRD